MKVAEARPAAAALEESEAQPAAGIPAARESAWRHLRQMADPVRVLRPATGVGIFGRGAPVAANGDGLRGARGRTEGHGGTGRGRDRRGKDSG